MPSSINSTTTSPGGLITTGDNSNILEIKTADTTAITINGSQQVSLAQPLGVASGGTGLSSPGAAGNILTSNGTAWTSAAPAPSAGSFTATASGSLSPNVGVVSNSNGTVSSILGNSFSAGTPQYNSASFSSGSSSIGYDPVNNKVLVAYRDSSTNEFKAIVGTVSGTAISWGTAVTFASAFSAGTVQGVTYHPPSGRMIIAWNQSGTDNRLIAGLISGTSITFGSSVQVSSTVSTFLYTSAPAYDPTSQSIVLTFINSDVVLARAFSVSGSTLTAGSAVQIGAFNMARDACTVTADPISGKCVAVVRNGSSYYDVVSFSISGTTITPDNNGTQFVAAQAPYVLLTYTTGGVMALLYSEDTGGGTFVAYMRALTLSGTTFTFSTIVRVDSTAFGIAVGLTYDSVADKVVTFINTNASPNTGEYKYFNLNGTASAPTLFYNANSSMVAGQIGYLSGTPIVYIGSAKTAFVGLSSAGNNMTNVYNSPYSNLTATNFVGFPADSYTNGQTATIRTLGSVVGGFTGLTPAAQYRVNPDTGGLTTTTPSPAVVAGKAISSTQLLVTL